MFIHLRPGGRGFLNGWKECRKEVIKEKYVENFKLYFFASACLCMWEYVRCIIAVCVNAWQDREQYKQFGPDIISKLLVRIIEMLSDAKAMCQQTDTHCERNTNANIIDHRVREKETRDTNTLDYTSPSTLNGDSTITHW